MNAMHQHMIDAYRATQHGTRIPPQPGRHDWQAARELVSQAQAPARTRAPRPGRRLRAALRRLAGRPPTVRQTRGTPTPRFGERVEDPSAT
ncbi:hypothetical protein [Streptomyces sp. NPDC047315]|uniref:hypothetical protein n=1 Tax=Streptomyces sp. NPDC047315 TaxID=3155142 RepID=UPI0033EEC7A5